MPINEVITRIEKLKSFKDYNMKELVRDAEEVGKQIKDDGVSVSSIRNIHSEILRISTEIKKGKKSDEEEFNKLALDRVYLLKPKISYLSERLDKKPENLKKVICASVDKITKKEDFLKFKNFYDSILMFHKAYGGRK